MLSSQKLTKCLKSHQDSHFKLLDSKCWPTNKLTLRFKRKFKYAFNSHSWAFKRSKLLITISLDQLSNDSIVWNTCKECDQSHLNLILHFQHRLFKIGLYLLLILKHEQECWWWTVIVSTEFYRRCFEFHWTVLLLALIQKLWKLIALNFHWVK